jgi:hypothetical protein
MRLLGKPAMSRSHADKTLRQTFVDKFQLNGLLFETTKNESIWTDPLYTINKKEFLRKESLPGGLVYIRRTNKASEPTCLQRIGLCNKNMRKSNLTQPQQLVIQA